MIYARWHGGGSYSPGDLDDALEMFPSEVEARLALEDRYRSNGLRRCAFSYTHGGGCEVDCYTPAVDMESSMDVYLYDPREVSDPYPDVFLFLVADGDDVRATVDHGS